MKKNKVALLAVAMLGMSAATASATYMADIDYTATQSGNHYTFTFDVANTSDGGSAGKLDFFEITFDADLDSSLYTNISWINDQGWFATAAQSDGSYGGLPGAVNADDAVDTVGGSGGIAQGNHQGGFQVSFDYSGALSVSDQLFSWYAAFGTYTDPTNGNLSWDGEAYGGTGYVDGGTTPPVPEPATMLLMGTGLAGLVAARRKKSQ